MIDNNLSLNNTYFTSKKRFPTRRRKQVQTGWQKMRELTELARQFRLGQGSFVAIRVQRFLLIENQ